VKVRAKAEPKPPKEPSPEPTFELPKHLVEYEGHPDDRKALMAWRAEHNRVSESLANAKREYEKRKRSELRKEQERERMERLRLEEQVEQKRLKAKAEEERKEKEHRKRESKRMDEDAAVAVRTKALGKDRFLRTYWWGIGGVKGAVYVEDLKGNWGVLTARREVDALVDALHVWGVREKALKQNLHRRIHTIHAEFRKRAREEDEELPGAEASGERTSRSETRPTAPADESAPLDATRRFAETLCAAAETAAAHRSDGTAGPTDGSLWRGIRATLRQCQTRREFAREVLALEAALYDVQVREFMSPEEAAARRAAEEAGERYESDEDREEEYYVDDDEEELFGDFRDNETYESKVASGLIYPMWDTKFERNKWRESVGENPPGAALAFAAACLEDAAGPFLRAMAKIPR